MMVSGRQRSRGTRGALLTAFMLAWLAATAAVAAEPAPAAAPPQADAFDDFDDFDDAQGRPTVAALRERLGQVPGEPYEISEHKRHERAIRQIRGLFRLSLPWPAGSALRFSVVEPSPLMVHVWNGSRGVTLRYYPEFQQSWAAFGSARQPGKARPESRVLWATSGDRYRRSGTGTVALVWREGQLALVRGDLTLLSVPFEGPPAEVYFEATGLVRGLDVTPTHWSPEPIAAPAPEMRTDRPADLAWQLTLPEKETKIALAKLADGRVELAAGERTQQAQAVASLALGKPGPMEIRFEVEDAEPGTGVCLADGQGKQLVRMAFVRHRESGKTAFELVPAYASETEKTFDANRQPVPWAGTRHWLRIVVGAGLAVSYTSGDGVHWSPPAPTAAAVDGVCTRLGLYCLAGEKRRAIKLRSIAVRRLDSLVAAAPETVKDRVPKAVVESESPDAWLKNVAQSRAADVEGRAWLRACAVQTVCQSPRAWVAQAALERLQQAVLCQGEDADYLLRFMDEASMLCPPQDWGSMDRLTAHGARLGRALVRLGHTAPCSALSRAMMRWPVWHARRLPVFDGELVRHELFARAGEGRWNELGLVCRRLRFWNMIGGPREGEQPPWSPHAEYLVRWAETLAARHLPRLDGGKPAGAAAPMAVDPLQDRLSREGYNTMAELRAAVESRAFRDACQIIAAVSDPDRLGLLPDPGEWPLSVSFPAAVEEAVRGEPALRQAMLEQFGRIGRLRLQQAMAAGDAMTASAVAVHLAGTEIASEAHRWLGDRATSGGHFAEAMRHYRRAAQSAAESQRGPLAARARLAAALCGRDAGVPVKEPVELGNHRLAPAEFEQMVASMRQARAESAPEPAGLPPGRYEARAWAQLEGRDVKRPANMPDRGLDWAGRLTAVAVAGGQWLVNNRIEQVAFRLDGGRAWQERSVADEGRQRWPLVPMEPLVEPGRVVLRRLTNDGPQLACLDRATGRLLWAYWPEEPIVSDPLSIDGKLLVLTAAVSSGRIVLALVGLSPASGELRSRTVLAEFRDFWRGQIPCRVAKAEDRLVAAVGGCLLCCDPAGRVLWLRRQVWTPPAGLEYHDGKPWLDPVLPAPLVLGAGIVATQPGVWGLECVDLDSGRLRWRRPVGGILRLVGAAAGKLVVQTDDGLLGLDAGSGKVLWTHDAPHCLETRLCGPPDAVLYVQAGPKKEAKDPPQFVFSWVAVSTGRLLGRSAVPAPRPGELWLGPIVSGAGRNWALLATVQEPAKREILELVRVGEASRDESLEDWSR